jgi:hypothetical protein
MREKTMNIQIILLTLIALGFGACIAGPTPHPAQDSGLGQHLAGASDAASGVPEDNTSEPSLSDALSVDDDGDEGDGSHADVGHEDGFEGDGPESDAGEATDVSVEDVSADLVQGD